MEKIYLDENGYQEYLKAIEKIREKIKQNSTDITEFQSDDAYGDGWHDNFAYEQAIKKENALFYELEQKLKGLNNIEIIKDKDNKKGLGLNNIVEILFDKEQEIEVYKLTGGINSNMDNEIPKISINSPLGKAIYNKKVNNIFEYEVDGIKIIGKIINIR